MPSFDKPTPRKELIACKDNQIIRVSGQVIKRDTLTALQQKIVLFSSALVRSEHDFTTRYEMTIIEFAELCKIKIDKRHSIYEEVYQQANKMRKLGVVLLNSDGDADFAQYLVDIRISKKRGTVSFRLSEFLLPYYKQYNQEFTRIDLIDCMPLKGQYAVRMYEIMVSWLKKKDKQVTYSMEQLYKLLDVPENKYKRIVDFMRRVINPAVDEINEKCKVFSLQIHEHRGKWNKGERLTFVITPDTANHADDTKKSIVSLLVANGLTATVAKKLANTYKEDRIKNNIAYTKVQQNKGKISDYPAYICKAIVDNYARSEEKEIFNEVDVAANETAATLTGAALAKKDCPICGGKGYTKIGYKHNGDFIITSNKSPCKCWSGRY